MVTDTAAVFKALADPSRRTLLDLLHAGNGQTLSQLCGHLDMTRQAVTKHLALLERANLLVTFQIDALGDVVRLTMTESHQIPMTDKMLEGGRRG